MSLKTALGILQPSITASNTGHFSFSILIALYGNLYLSVQMPSCNSRCSLKFPPFNVVLPLWA